MGRDQAARGTLIWLSFDNGKWKRMKVREDRGRVADVEVEE